MRSVLPRNDAEGLACRRNLLIDHGTAHRLRLRHDDRQAGGYLFDRFCCPRRLRHHADRRMQGHHDRTRPARPAPESSSPSETGLFVQSMTGVHSGVSSVSGDFSVGVEGLLIRGGQLAEPVHEVTIASTLQRMLLSIVAIGGDVEWLPGVAAAQTDRDRRDVAQRFELSGRGRD